MEMLRNDVAITRFLCATDNKVVFCDGINIHCSANCFCKQNRRIVLFKGELVYQKFQTALLHSFHVLTGQSVCELSAENKREVITNVRLHPFYKV